MRTPSPRVSVVDVRPGMPRDARRGTPQQSRNQPVDRSIPVRMLRECVLHVGPVNDEVQATRGKVWRRVAWPPGAREGRCTSHGVAKEGR